MTKYFPSPRIKQPIELILFLLLLGSVLIQRAFVLNKFGFVYVDSDQSIMWLALKNYASGQFHEPRFYGQAYSTMIEAFLAVPLYKLGLAAFIALPIISSVLSLTPYFILAVLCYKKGNFLAAYLILSLPLLLPVEYSLITSMPRGFVGGLFLASLSFLFLNLSNIKLTFLITAFFSLLAYSVNSNSILVSAPIVLYHFLYHYKKKAFYIYFFIGLILAFIPHYLADQFYVLHPNYSLHKVHLDFSITYILESLKHLDDYLNFNAPLFWHGGSNVLLVFLALALYFFKQKKWQEGCVVMSIPFLILLTLGIGKVHDGIDSIFFSRSRMYLGLPVLLAFSISLIPALKWQIVQRLYILLPLWYLFIQLNSMDKVIEKNTNQNKDHVVAIQKVSQLISQCNYLNAICKALEIDLVIVSKHWLADAINYGCTACITNYPPSIRPSYERRTWRLIEDKEKVYKRILIVEVSRDLAKEFRFIKKLTCDANLFYLKNNSLPTMELLKQLKIDVRDF